MSRTAIAILSTENLLHNLRVIKKKAPHSKIIAMVKANAYGHGLRSVSSRLQKHVDMLGVACIDEALALRKIGITIPIMLAEGVFEPNELIIASAEGFHVVFHEEAQVKWLEKLSFPVSLHAWIKINTGMGRLGFNLKVARSFYERLQAHQSVVKPVKIMSHFGCADDKEHPLNSRQLQEFKSFTADLKTQFSIANSAVIFNYPEAQYDFVRPGIALYGASPLHDKTAPELNLKPVMTVQSSIIAVHNMKAGDSVGYAARFVCPEDMPVGVVAFGYGDGYPFTSKEGTPILVNNTRCSVIGRISMDMLTVDLRSCRNVEVGDPVILWGEGLPVGELTAYTDQTVYSILTGVQNRVKFLWTRSPEGFTEDL